MHSLYWWLGEFLAWIHIPYAIAVLLLGFLWIRPIWIWLVHNAVVTSLQLYYDDCPLVVLERWLKGEGPRPSGWVTSIIHAYGYTGFLIVALTLGAVGAWIAWALRRPLNLTWMRGRWSQPS